MSEPRCCIICAQADLCLTFFRTIRSWCCHCLSASASVALPQTLQCADQLAMERPSLLFLVPFLASIIAVATADSAKVALYRKSSQLDPNGRRSAQNVVCEFLPITPQMAPRLYAEVHFFATMCAYIIIRDGVAFAALHRSRAKLMTHMTLRNPRADMRSNVSTLHRASLLKIFVSCIRGRASILSHSRCCTVPVGGSPSAMP